MESKKIYIPIKVLVSYVVLAALVIGVGIVLYSENILFSDTENKTAQENNRILKISALLSNVNETESLSRITIQSNTNEDLLNFTRKTDSLIVRIDSVKLLVTTSSQRKLLDSVKLLLSKKTENILQLKKIKSRATDEVKVKNAINDLTRMELSLRKLRLEDFVKDPKSLGDYELSVLKRYVAYLNQNIPSDNSNTLTQRALDSMLVASKKLLNDVKQETKKRNDLLNSEEKKLLQNELSISTQLRKIVSVIEREIILNTTKSNIEKEQSLKKIIRIVAIASTIGLLLTLFFSMLIINDFSNTQSYKKKLEIANLRTNSLLRNREQLISTVSHDLKTPLNTIIGYTELLENSGLTQKQSYYNANVKGSSAYISHLIQDLLDFTQIEAGKITIESKPFSLDLMVSEVAKSIRSLHAQKNIDLKIDIDQQLDQKILGDAFRLRQVLSNLIGNAYKFTESGFIKITASPNATGDLVVISIEDSGIGIALEKQELIFEEFTQADENIEKNYGGTGLGLTISRKIMNILGGKLTLTSSLGKGSIFTIEFPLAYAEEIKSATENTTTKTHTALIIDDDANLLNLTTEILKQREFEVCAFTKASEALEFLKHHEVDFIITDIQMPEIDGFEFIKLLMKQPGYQNKKKPVIALTGKANINEAMYRSAGFSAIVKKPYSPSVFIETIQHILAFPTQSKPISVASESLENGSFSLVSLQTFFPNDSAAMNEVLHYFIRNTKSSVTALTLAIKNNDDEAVKMLSHRMAPMFRQISANEISNLLEKLEMNDYSKEERQLHIEKLQGKIELLLSEIETTISNPSHNG